MPTCPSCGKDSPEGFQFCPYCGAPLRAPAAPNREVRKTVTVVFTDVTGSTALGERLDPESLRRVMGRYFDRMKGVLERHGGTVEKFIGDAVMAVFGIPALHEDDALRAVRAASEMREELAALNAELKRDHGVTMATRTGVNTGPVVAGDLSAGQTLVTGDAVNTAARLEQNAEPGEVLIGEPTYRLVRDAVKVEAVEPVEAKGKAEPVGAYRLLGVIAGAAPFARRLDSPIVGRGRELRLLAEAFDRAGSERACFLFTVLGSAGVDKSRLVQEFLGQVADRARVLRGQCLPYGEGITFWPVAEIVKQAAGITDEDPPEVAQGRLASLVAGLEHSATIAERVGQAIGLVRDSAVPEETFWGVRSFLEALASREPLVVVFDDVQWAEPTFLDLVEHVADWSRDAPMLLLALARPELLDQSPAWGGGKMNATSILLEPLSERDCGDLIANLLGTAQVPPELAGRITEAAEGNPLFVEEMLSVLIDDGLLLRVDGRWEPAGDLEAVAVPPTIHALLSARLDRLSAEERVVLGCGAVEGRVFSLDAVRELCPAALREAAQGHMMALVRKDLVRPGRGELRGEAFRFRHQLIRDAAYEAIPKSERSELQERFARWLEGEAGDRLPEYEEIVGYHLEQAHRYRTELGPPDDRTAKLATRAVERLSGAGRRAKARHDVPAAGDLLGRAVALAPSDDPELLVDLGEALYLAAEYPRADAVFTRAAEAADREGNFSAGARARLFRAQTQLLLDPEGKTEQALAEAERLIPALTEAGDDRGLAAAYLLRARAHLMHMSNEPAHEDLFRAAAHARTAGDPVLEIESLAEGIVVLLFGPTPPGQVLDRLDELAPVFQGVPWRAFYESKVRSDSLALLGRFEEAREVVARGAELCIDLGARFGLAAISESQWHIERLAGDHEAAERSVRAGYDMLKELGDQVHLSTWAGYLARTCVDLGRLEGAERYAEECQRLSASDDLINHWLWRAAQAHVLVGRGDFQQAERLAREAVAFLEPTDDLWHRGEATADLAGILALVGKTEEAEATYQEPLALFERKGVLPGMDHVARAIQSLKKGR